MTYKRGVITYPVPLFQNLPIEAQFYEPSIFNITSITLGATTTVTTSLAHNYVIEQQCRLVIPPSFGCRQLNGVTGYVVSIPATNQVVLNLNTTGGDPFVLATSNIQVAQIAAVGDISSGPINPYGNLNTLSYIPGSFINISPL